MDACKRHQTEDNLTKIDFPQAFFLGHDSPPQKYDFHLITFFSLDLASRALSHRLPYHNR